MPAVRPTGSSGSFVPLSASVAAAFLPSVRLLATDMDGTLTRRGKFSSALLRALEQLAQGDRAVLIVTGRSAGWVSGLANYLPVAGAIAENGGVFYEGCSADGGLEPQWLVAIDDIEPHRRALAALFEDLRSRYPQLRESADNRFRLTDWTFDVAGLSPEVLAAIARDCGERGWGFTFSSVQGHLKLPQQDKAAGVRQVMSAQFPELAPQQVVTVGDSPNDASLFDRRQFPHSVGVANVADYRGQLEFEPQYVTQAAEGDGFCELAQYCREYGVSGS